MNYTFLVPVTTYYIIHIKFSIYKTLWLILSRTAVTFEIVIPAPGACVDLPLMMIRDWVSVWERGRDLKTSGHVTSKTRGT